MWAGRDYDLYIERTALMMPTIPIVVDGVSSTLIHLTTGPDGYEALVWRRGNRAGPRRLIFESSTWKLTGPSSRVITTSAERKSRSFSSTASPWRPPRSTLVTCRSAICPPLWKSDIRGLGHRRRPACRKRSTRKGRPDAAEFITRIEFLAGRSVRINPPGEKST